MACVFASAVSMMEKFFRYYDQKLIMWLAVISTIIWQTQKVSWRKRRHNKNVRQPTLSFKLFSISYFFFFLYVYRNPCCLFHDDNNNQILHLKQFVQTIFWMGTKNTYFSIENTQSLLGFRYCRSVARVLYDRLSHSVCVQNLLTEKIDVEFEVRKYTESRETAHLFTHTHIHWQTEPRPTDWASE